MTDWRMGLRSWPEDRQPLPDRYRPVIRGLRHRTGVMATPPNGTVVTLLCGVAHVVGFPPKTTHIYDCSACEAEYKSLGRRG